MRRLLVTTLILTARISLAQDPEPAKEPAELTKAREAYMLQIKKVQAPVTEQYVKDLKVMVKKFGEAGKLKEGLAIQDEIAKYDRPDVLVTPKTAKKDDAPGFIGKWRLADATVEILKDGTCTYKGSGFAGEGTWTLVDDHKIKVKWDTGNAVITFDDNFKNYKQRGETRKTDRTAERL